MTQIDKLREIYFNGLRPHIKLEQGIKRVYVEYKKGCYLMGRKPKKLNIFLTSEI